MVIDESLREELIKKYQWAGRIRFFSFFLLFLFLMLMKLSGGYSYLNVGFCSLIFVEALINQPYGFLLKRVNLYRFQFYQMVTDIIAVSWILYYMGGIDAHVISMGYYAVILWAGVVSTPQAVFFAVITSCILFSSVVILEHFGILPHIAYFANRGSTSQAFSLLLGNLAFLFAFGYFSARSSKVIKHLENKRQEEALKYTHKLIATGYLLEGAAHDMLNHLMSVKNYAKVLLEKINSGQPEDLELTNTQMLNRMSELQTENIDLLSLLSRFSRKKEEKRELTDLNLVIEGALGLTLPLARASNVVIEKQFEKGVPLVMVDKDQMQEVFVILLLNSLDGLPQKGKITLTTSYLKAGNCVEVILSDTGLGTKQDYLKRIAEPFFSGKETSQDSNLGLSIVYEILSRQKGKIDIDSAQGKGTTVVIRMPAL